ncbi:MAG: hypothetical protein RMX96_29915 [Nostoc sp. ChiSLP02]|nr:hypothetical protein [Nostoc sp. DedSLP05]MDZ8100614.1 hypothetical protein [Nostoc sp. DedSLP01]MDZ8189049.1 hypothetical protein [Nostoc sp. ChiSLP02]
MSQITTAEFSHLLAEGAKLQPFVLDARSQAEYAISHIRKAVRIDPVAPDLAVLSTVPKDTPIVVALVGLGQKYLSFNNSILQYASQASYPFYLLHQTVLVAVAFYTVQWNLGIGEKFLIISSASILLTGGLYKLLIKRINISRYLFGLKPIDIRQK